MKTEAAVLVETGKPLEIAELEIPALRAGHCLVEIAYSGACHTQVLEARGRRGADPWLPHCLGHEASGIVLETGADVSRAEVGDRVVLSWLKGGGIETGGTVYDWNGRMVNAGAVTTFQRHAVVSENRVTKLPDALDLRRAILLGCALPTGLGAVTNVARPVAGESAVVFGAGGVGLCAVMGAVVSGCAPVIAVDLRQEKLDLARTFGATHGIDAGKGGVEAAIREICPGGVDVAIEATGRPKIMADALSVVRSQGGRAVIVGNAPKGETMLIDPGQLNLGKSLLGTWGGDSQPDRDYRRYAALMTGGRLDVEPLLSDPYRLDEINRVLDDLESGRIGRPVIRMAENSD